MPALGQYARGGPYIWQPLGFQAITATNLASAYSLTPPPGAQFALISVYTAAVNFRDDGTAPTASVGQTLTPGVAPAPFFYFGNLAAIQFILVSGSPTMSVSYYR